MLQTPSSGSFSSTHAFLIIFSILVNGNSILWVCSRQKTQESSLTLLFMVPASILAAVLLAPPSESMQTPSRSSSSVALTLAKPLSPPAGEPAVLGSQLVSGLCSWPPTVFSQHSSWSDIVFFLQIRLHVLKCFPILFQSKPEFFLWPLWFHMICTRVPTSLTSTPPWGHLTMLGVLPPGPFAGSLCTCPFKAWGSPLPRELQDLLPCTYSFSAHMSLPQWRLSWSYLLHPFVATLLTPVDSLRFFFFSS